jgi:hypothetical protein
MALRLRVIHEFVDTLSGLRPMSFRQNNEPARSWRSWYTKHAAELFACGIPDVAYRDSRAWEHFLNDGGHLLDQSGNWGTWNGWNVHLLTHEQAVRLREFLTRECQWEGGYVDIVNELEKHLRKHQEHG